MHIINLNKAKNIFPFIISIVVFRIALNHGIYYVALIPGLFLLAVALYSPFIAYLIHVFFFFHPLIGLSRTITGCVALVSFVLYLLVEKKKLIIDINFSLLLAYAVVFFLSGIMNGSLLGHEESTFVFLIRIFQIFMYMLMLNIINNKEKLRTVINSMIFFAVMQSFIAIIQYFLNIGSKMEDYRPPGTTQDVPEMAMMLFFVIPFMIGVTSHTHTIRWKRTVFLMTTPVMFAIFLAASRAYFISLVIFSLVFFFYNMNVRYLKYFTLVIIFIGFFILAGHNKVIERTIGILKVGNLNIMTEATTSVNLRFISYQIFGELIKKYPIFGIGPANFYTKALEHDLKPPGKGFGVHNIFMNVALESGTIGLISYIILLLYTWKSIVKSQKIVQEYNDLEMLYYIRSLKYAFGMGIIGLQASGTSFAFPIVTSIGLSGVIKRIVSSSTKIKKNKSQSSG